MTEPLRQYRLTFIVTDLRPDGGASTEQELNPNGMAGQMAAWALGQDDTLNITYETERVVPPFKCQAIMQHGPGHQSRTECELTRPHSIEGEHWAADPMCPGFEWEGAVGYD